ncbi:MAG: Flp family type IVb pilin [Alphaproteobacteria bacterium]|nr:Flp family type IVb pilin [Alphaproteobacteria bacterium]
MKVFIKFFKQSNRGASAIEYVLIATLLGVCMMGAYKNFGNKYLSLYNQISDGLNDVSFGGKE